jgi:hypothetical protein
MITIRALCIISFSKRCTVILTLTLTLTIMFLLLIMAVLDSVRSLALSSKHLCVIPLHLNHRILTV